MLSDLDRAIDALSDGVLTLDGDLNFGYVNPSAARLIGRSPEELCGTYLWTGFPQLEGSVFDRRCREALEHQRPVEFEEFLERLGTWVTIRAVPYCGGLTVHYQDITERRRAEEELVQSKDRFERQFRGLPVPTYSWRHEGEDFLLVDCNDAAIDATEGQIGRFIGRQLSDVHADEPRVRRDLERCHLSGKPITREMHYKLRSTGVSRDLVVTYVPVPPATVMVHTLDVTARLAGERALREMAERDGLTGLHNRRFFEERLADRAGREGGGAVVIVDIDHFKFVNDSLGHAAGDELLRDFSALLVEHVRDGDVVARLGGDEFAVLLADQDEAAAKAVAGKLLKVVRDRSSAVHVTASAGVATFAADGPTAPADAMIAADIALYDAKQHGRDRAAVFGGEPGESLTWLERVRAAIREERLVVHAQPIVDLIDGEVVMEELLVRMRDEDGKLVPPSSFLPTAEQFGLIRDIDRWVIRQGVARAATGRHVQINLSARSLADLELPGELAAELAAHGTNPANVSFEYTETAAISNLDDARKFTEALRALGCDAALDDFGTGFSSFLLLKHLPVTTLKIDMEFVRGLSTSQADQRIVRSIVHTAREGGLRTVAEGVEDEGALALLRTYGVDYAQGFHIGRPAPL